MDGLDREGEEGAVGFPGRWVKQPSVLVRAAGQCRQPRVLQRRSRQAGRRWTGALVSSTAQLLGFPLGLSAGHPARAPCRVAGGEHQGALSRGEQCGHFKNHLRHFCILEALSLLALPKMPWDRERSGGQTQGSGAGMCRQ